MALNLPLLICIFAIFVVILISYAKKGVDFVAISLFCCFLTASITAFFSGATFADFVDTIEFEAIVVILCMSIITKVAQESNILEYLAVKLFKISKGNPRVFLYLICIITTLLAAIISDVVVVLILAPVVIRICRFLKIRAGTYLLGMTICINIGSIITPFSSGENIIIATYFGLDTLYFIQYYWIFSFLLLFFTIFLIDKLLLSKEPKIEEQQKKYVLELIDASVMIKNKKMFYFNSIAIILTIASFALIPWLYLTAAFSSLIMVMVNKNYTKKSMSELLKDVEWEIIFFFISLYIVIGCMLIAGFQDLFKGITFQALDPLVLSIIMLLAISLISGFVANTPTALIFIPIIDLLIQDYGFSPVPLMFAFIIGINLGGNLIPQGAACDVMTLKIAQNNGVENLDFKRLLKTGASFAILHIVLSIMWLPILILIYG